MKRDGVRLGAAALVVLVIGAALPALLFGPLLGTGDAARLQAALTYAGVMITAAVTLIGMAVKWQSDKRLTYEKEEQLKQLRLDAAMKAGQLLSPVGTDHAQPAAMASGLLALTRLEQADLAVTLLVDLWSGSGRSSDNDKVSTETAILVIDAALRSASPNAQLVAAELLCRNGEHLQPGRSLDWPSSLEGCWIPTLSHRAKLLIVEALVRSTLASDSSETSLRSAAVRLYGIWRDDKDERVRGCIGKLISALIPRIEDLHYTDFMQGNQVVMLDQLKTAAASAHTNPDGYLDQLSTQFADKLADWASKASGLYTGPGCLAACEHSPNNIRSDPPRRRQHGRHQMQYNNSGAVASLAQKNLSEQCFYAYGAPDSRADRRRCAPRRS
jgi:hypothetical protein